MILFVLELRNSFKIYNVLVYKTFVLIVFVCLDLFSAKVGLFSQVPMAVTCTTSVQPMNQLWYYNKILKITVLKNRLKCNLGRVG